jgi:hypothetical protein
MAHQCRAGWASAGNKPRTSGVPAEQEIHRSAIRAEGDRKEIPMNCKSSLLIGVLALSVPAVAQTTTGAPPTTTNGSTDQIGAGTNTDMNATKHHARKHHKHAKTSSTKSSPSNEVAETNRLNQQQLSQARSGSSTTTAGAAGSQNENAATYNGGAMNSGTTTGTTTGTTRSPNDPTMGPPVGPGATPPGPNNTPSDANPGAQPSTPSQNPPQ